MRSRCVLVAIELAFAVVAVSAQAPTFRAATRLVQVNVIVRGKDGQAVPGLTAADFTLLDGGKPQPIELFSVQSNQPSGPGAAPASPPPSAGNGDFSNGIGTATGGATVILLDRANTAPPDQNQARNQLLKFLGQIRPEDRVAIYTLGVGSVHVLHDCTSDSASLVRVLSRLNARREVPLAATGAPPSDSADTDSSSDNAMAQALASLPAMGTTKGGIAVHSARLSFPRTS